MTAPLLRSDRVAPTIHPADAARERWDTVVVGAGPAGCAAARRLASAGLRVLVVDRCDLPRGKVCGCCLSPRALGELAALGPGAAPAGLVPLERVRLSHGGRAAAVAFGGGGIVSRETLDAGLLRHAIAAGCHWLPRLHVTALEAQRHAEHAVLHGGVAGSGDAAIPILARMTILATGITDGVRVVGARGHDAPRRVAPRSRLGVGTVLAADAAAFAPGELLMAVAPEGYCGIVRLEDGRIDVAAAIDRAAIASADGNVARAVAAIVAAAAPGASPLPADVLRAAPFRATPPLSRAAPLTAGVSGRILRIGDAAAYVEPFTGEGIGWALASGRLVAEAILAGAGLDDPPAAAARHAASHRRFFGPRHGRCALVSGGLRRPGVVATALVAARTFPGVARRVLPALVGAWGEGDRA